MQNERNAFCFKRIGVKKLNPTKLEVLFIY